MNDRIRTGLTGTRSLRALPPCLISRIESMIPAKASFGLAAVVLERPWEILDRDSNTMFSAASISKLFVAAEVLRQVEINQLNYDSLVSIEQENCVGDPNGLLSRDKIDDLVADSYARVDYLLDVMLRLSSNTAANVLIDLVTRESINYNVIERFNWFGSKVNRKFLPRALEASPYTEAPPNLTCAAHTVEFLLRLDQGHLISPFISTEIVRLLTGSRRDGALSIDESNFDSFYHKIGSLEVRSPSGSRRWQHDVGVAKRLESGVALSILTCHSPESDNEYFPLAEVQRLVFEFYLSH